MHISPRTVYKRFKRLGGGYPAGMRSLRFPPGLIREYMEGRDNTKWILKWSYSFTHRGVNYAARGYETRRGAEAARVKRREDVKALAAENVKKIQTATGFKAIANDYLDLAQRKYVHDVYLRKVNACKRFRATLPGGDMQLDEISPKHVHDFLKTLKSNSLYNENRHELSAFFNWAKKTYVQQFPFFVNPCLAVESMSHVTREKKIPTEREILRLIAAAIPGEQQDIILTCLHTLGRIDEILRLRWIEDVNFDKRYVVLWTRKRRQGAYEPDALPMNDDLYAVLWRRWNDRKQDKWVFYNEKKETRYMARPKLMAALCKRAGIEPIGTTTRKYGRGKKKGQTYQANLYYGFHSLRHFMASYMLDVEKVSLKATGGLLRHKQARTTEVYLHTPPDSLVAALGKIQGKFTPKKANVQPLGATKPQKRQKKGLDKTSNP